MSKPYINDNLEIEVDKETMIKKYVTSSRNFTFYQRGDSKNKVKAGSKITVIVGKEKFKGTVYLVGSLNTGELSVSTKVDYDLNIVQPK